MLIRTNALRGLVEAESGGSPVTDRWSELHGLLSQKYGADVANLFAEPSISRGNGAAESVARWHTDADGAAISYAALEPAGRTAASAQLTALLSRLEPSLRDPATAGLIGSALYIPSMADVMLVGGRPVIVNWGFLPSDIANSATRRDSHFRSTLGQFVPGIGAPEFDTGRLAAAAAPAAATAAAAAAPVAAAPVVVAATSRPWLGLAIANGIALLVLAILLLPGVLEYPGASASADDLDLRRQMNRSLEEQIDRLKRQLQQAAVCTPTNPAGTPNRTGNTTPATAPGTTPGTTPATTPGRREASTPNSPPTDGTHPLSNADLLKTLERSTVLVLVPSLAEKGGGLGLGTGFFINDKQIVTNRHVVQGEGNSAIFVTSKTLGRVGRARVVAIASPSQQGDDFAVLEIDQPTSAPPLALAPSIDRLSPVTAAGFPGLIVTADQSFRKLIEGDVTAVPEMVVTQGIVTVTQARNNVTYIIHTATIAPGNSGGPLADACGRVVAVNTFHFGTKTGPATTFNGGLASENLARFLGAANVSFTSSTGACEAGATAAPPAPAPAPTPTPPAATPPAQK